MQLVAKPIFHRSQHHVARDVAAGRRERAGDRTRRGAI
jgi:hypothetical protein